MKVISRISRRHEPSDLGADIDFNEISMQVKAYHSYREPAVIAIALENCLCTSADASIYIMHQTAVVVGTDQALRMEGITTAQIVACRDSFTKPDRARGLRNCIELLTDRGIVPIVFEGGYFDGLVDRHTSDQSINFFNLVTASLAQEIADWCDVSRGWQPHDLSNRSKKYA